jgi:serine/threonine protein kinase
MEFLNGGNLEFHLTKLKRFEEKQVQFYAAQIVCGFTYLDENKILDECQN